MIISQIYGVFRYIFENGILAVFSVINSSRPIRGLYKIPRKFAIGNDKNEIMINKNPNMIIIPII